jgi:hypothetical protein
VWVAVRRECGQDFEKLVHLVGIDPASSGKAAQRADHFDIQQV